MDVSLCPRTPAVICPGQTFAGHDEAFSISIVDAELIVEAPKHCGQHPPADLRDQAGPRLARRLPCIQAPMLAASNADALRQHADIIPARTSPAPRGGEAQGGALAAMVRVHPGDATTVSGPLSRTRRRSVGGCPTRSSFERLGCLLLISLNSAEILPSCGVRTTCGRATL